MYLNDKTIRWKTNTSITWTEDVFLISFIDNQEDSVSPLIQGGPKNFVQISEAALVFHFNLSGGLNFWVGDVNFIGGGGWNIKY